MARQHLNKQVSVEFYEKQNSSFVLTPIRVYVFGLSFLTTLDTNVEQPKTKFVTGDKVSP